MTCGKKHCNNSPTEATRVEHTELEGRPRCLNPRCQRRLRNDGSCPRGCRQGFWDRVQQRVWQRLGSGAEPEWWSQLAKHGEAQVLIAQLEQTAQTEQEQQDGEAVLWDWQETIEDAVGALELFREKLQVHALTYAEVEEAFGVLEKGGAYGNVAGLAASGRIDRDRTFTQAYEIQQHNDELAEQREEVHLRRRRISSGEAVCPTCGGDLERAAEEDEEEPWVCPACGEAYTGVHRGRRGCGYATGGRAGDR